MKNNKLFILKWGSLTLSLIGMVGTTLATSMENKIELQKLVQAAMQKK